MKENYSESELTDRNKKIESDQNAFEISQAAQVELIKRYGDDNAAAKWIEMNSKRFREIINDPNYNLIERLADDNDREEALKEIQ